jgi:hypothetical protein
VEAKAHKLLKAGDEEGAKALLIGFTTNYCDGFISAYNKLFEELVCSLIFECDSSLPYLSFSLPSLYVEEYCSCNRTPLFNHFSLLKKIKGGKISRRLQCSRFECGYHHQHALFVLPKMVVEDCWLLV